MSACNICGCFVENWYRHRDYHTRRNEGPVPQRRIQRRTGYCTECGAPITFENNVWRHPEGVSCNWTKGTPRDKWVACPRCGLKLVAAGGTHTGCFEQRTTNPNPVESDVRN